MRGDASPCIDPCCCIAGFCAKFSGDYKSQPHKNIAEYFGIEDLLAMEIYAPNEDNALWSAMSTSSKFITPEHAASVLFHLAESKTLDWSIEKEI